MCPVDIDTHGWSGECGGEEEKGREWKEEEDEIGFFGALFYILGFYLFGSVSCVEDTNRFFFNQTGPEKESPSHLPKRLPSRVRRVPVFRYALSFSPPRYAYSVCRTQWRQKQGFG